MPSLITATFKGNYDNNLSEIMKKVILLSAVLSFSSVASAEQSWWDNFLSAVGLGESEEVVETVDASQSTVGIDGLLSSLTSKLGVTKEQAQGGMAALFNFAKQNISEEQFSALTAQIPGLDSLMKYLPAISALNSEGMGGIMDMASGYSDKLSQVNDLKKQFDTLGLDTSMIGKYADQAQSYFDTPEASAAKDALTETFSNISL